MAQVYNITGKGYGDTIDSEYGKIKQHKDYEITITHNSITVNGVTMAIQNEYGMVYRLLKRSIRTNISAMEYTTPSLVKMLQDEFWIAENNKIIQHVLQHGKLAAQ